MGDTFGSSFAVRHVHEGVAFYMREVGYLSAGFVLVTIIDRGTGFPRSMICVAWLPSLIGGTVMNDLTIPKVDELLELTKQDRFRVFREDLRALDELAKVVHQKALNGDNAAGHLDLKIRERKAQMFGYDSPQQYDMTLVAELRRPTTTDAMKTIIDRMVNDGRISDDSKQRIRALGGYLPEPESLPESTSERTSDPDPDQ
jgi:hypothetical protein